MAKPKSKTRSTSTAVAPVGNAPAASLATLAAGNALLSKYAAVRQVILPALNLQVGEPRVLYIGDAFRVSTVKQEPKKNPKTGEMEAPEKPATVCTATDVDSGEMFTLLVPAVMESNMREAYPDGDYVGKTFYCEKLPKKPGKRYFSFKLIEVANPNVQAA